MGSWGIGPFENDGAMDLEAAVVNGLVATVVKFVEFTQLRARGDADAIRKAVDDGAPGIDKARAAIALLRMLLRNGIGEPIEPNDLQRWTAAIDASMTSQMFEPHAEQALKSLVKRELAELGSPAEGRTATSPTVATWPPTLSAVERTLLEHLAPSDLVAWSADFATADAAWQACHVAEWIPYLARVRGVTLDDVVMTLAHVVEGQPRELRDRLERQLYARTNRLKPGPSWASCAIVLRMMGRENTATRAAREQWEAEMAEQLRSALAS